MCILLLSNYGDGWSCYNICSQPTEIIRQVTVAVASNTSELNPVLHILPLNKSIVVEEVPEFIFCDGNNAQESFDIVLRKFLELTLTHCATFMESDYPW